MQNRWASQRDTIYDNNNKARVGEQEMGGNWPNKESWSLAQFPDHVNFQIQNLLIEEVDGSLTERTRQHHGKYTLEHLLRLLYTKKMGISRYLRDPWADLK